MKARVCLWRLTRIRIVTEKLTKRLWWEYYMLDSQYLVHGLIFSSVNWIDDHWCKECWQNTSAYMKSILSNARTRFHWLGTEMYSPLCSRLQYLQDYDPYITLSKHLGHKWLWSDDGQSIEDLKTTERGLHLSVRSVFLVLWIAQWNLHGATRVTRLAYNVCLAQLSSIQ